MKPLVSILLFMMMPVLMCGQDVFHFPGQLQFERYSTKDGLPAFNGARSMTIDKHGFIWFGTLNGLVKYDGYEFTIYKIDRPEFFANLIQEVLVDSRGWVWVIVRFPRNSYQLVRFNPIDEKFTILEQSKMDMDIAVPIRIRQLTEDRQGNIWLSTSQGVKRIQILDEELANVDVDTFHEKKIPDEVYRLLTKKEKFIAGFEQVGDSFKGEKAIQIKEKGTYLIISTGELFLPQMLFNDFGNLQDDEGNVMWQMNPRKAVHAGGGFKNRIQWDTLVLKPGKYSLNYTTDESHAIGSWNMPPPDFPDFWGIRLYEIEPSVYEEIQKLFESHRATNHILSGPLNMAILATQDGNIWVSNALTLDRITPDSKDSFSIKTYNYDLNNSLLPNQIQYIFEKSPGELWLSGFGRPNPYLENNKLALFLTEEEKFIPIKHDLKYHPGYPGWGAQLRDILEDKEGIFWLAPTTDHGLRRFQLPTNYKNLDTISITLKFFSLANWRDDPMDDDFENGLILHCLSLDRSGNIWVGSNEHGIFKIQQNTQALKYFELPEAFLSDNGVTLEIGWAKSDRLGNVYFTQRKSSTEYVIIKYDLNTNEVKQIATGSKDNPSKIIQKPHFKLFIDTDNQVWIGSTQGGNLYKYDPLTEKVEQYYSSSSRPIFPLFKDPEGQAWAIDAASNFYYLPKGEKTFQPLEIYPQDWKVGKWDGVQFPFEDSKGNQWIPYLAGGLGKISFQQDTFSFKEYIPEIRPRSLHETPDGRIWVGTLTNELWCYTPATDSIQKVIAKDENFSSLGRIAAIESDSLGRLWLYTFRKGMVLYDIQKNNFYKTTALQSITTGGIVFHPFVRTPEDQLIISQSNGFYLLEPEEITQDTNMVRVIIDEVSFVGSKASYSFYTLPKGVVKTSYANNDINIYFTGIYYINTADIQYAYKLDGVNDNWVNVGTERIARFADLAPGSYTFRVKAANADGVWSEEETTLQIRVLPPWWRTWWAYALYGALLFGGIYYAYQFQLNKSLAEAEAERLQELDALKSELYTNVTHEFRTPLTVILNAVPQIKEDSRQWLQQGLESIHRSAKQLLTLVNQMLDFTRLQTNTLPINMAQGNIIEYLRYLTESFDSYARSRNIRLHFLSEEQELIMDYDADKIMAIVSNLLSNAIKFTPDGGDVYLQIKQVHLAGQSALQMTVKDTGIGIAPEELDKVFEIFYQGKQKITGGTGIGLALVQRILQLLQGDIQVKSKEGRGSEFIVTLPISREAPLHDPLSPINIQEKTDGFIPSVSMDILEANDNNAEHPIALIAEDNEDVITYLSAQLQSQYQIVISRNGQEAIEKAIEIVPDIVLCDVMMPVKDGFEVLETLKNDQRTSHIPIILLTAKADITSRLEGISRGADAYLPKPYNRAELEAIIQQLISTRRKLRERYRQLEPVHTQDNLEIALEDAFILSVHEVLEKRYSASDFSVSELQSAMKLSRSQLYRKLKALTGYSVAIYIRNFRLEKARQFLASTNWSVKRVALEVGFTDPRYFSRVYKEYFGETPSETV